MHCKGGAYRCVAPSFMLFIEGIYRKHKKQTETGSPFYEFMKIHKRLEKHTLM